MRLTNTGNIGLQSASILKPSSNCTSGVLEPLASTTCVVSVTATQEHFEQGFISLLVEGMAVPRTATKAPFTWSGSALVKLMRVGRISVQPPKMPDRVASAGMQERLRLLCCHMLLIMSIRRHQEKPHYHSKA